MQDKWHGYKIGFIRKVTLRQTEKITYMNLLTWILYEIKWWLTELKSMYSEEMDERNLSLDKNSVYYL